MSIRSVKQSYTRPSLFELDDLLFFVSRVVYVLGQMQNNVASSALIRVLKDVAELPMVRHEAAEALGSIADEGSIALLEEFAKDPEPIVSQSCEVALSMLEFEKSGKSFEVYITKTFIRRSYV
ncbi:hypothetical protein RND81_10G242700 [Saponaria officinalis]|uniref:Deoxyhypusine hydroxylase n=1 Tax=Saponaria officinalis TaxID=3572 RepID=A0AAW1I5S4_SAPOF